MTRIEIFAEAPAEFAHLNELEAAAEAPEREASDIRWRQAEEVVQLLAVGWKQQQIADGWKRPNGEPYSPIHVHYVVKTWRAHLHLSEEDRPLWNEAYNSDLVRKGRRPTAIATPMFPPGEWPVLCADPPWRYDYAESSTRAVENHYPTMDLDALCELELPAADDAVLFCWATSPKLLDAIQLVEAWKFDYRTCLVWVKEQIGMGYYARQQHELLLVGRRGELPVPDPTDRPPSVFTAPRTRHSAKPAIAYELIERMYPTLPRVELFAARCPYRLGRVGDRSMIHAFETTVNHDGDAFWADIYRQAFTDYVCHETVVDKALQKQGIDHYIHLGPHVVSCDVKSRNYLFVGDVLIEAWSNEEAGVAGWTFQASRTDWIAYAWLPSARALLVPFPLLRTVAVRCEKRWLCSGNYRRLDVHNDGYTTVCVLVLESELFAELNNAMRVGFAK